MRAVISAAAILLTVFCLGQNVAQANDLVIDLRDPLYNTDDETLDLSILYAGGCKDHQFDLAVEKIDETDKTAVLGLIHYRPNDKCEGLQIHHETFDLQGVFGFVPTRFDILYNKKLLKSVVIE